MPGSIRGFGWSNGMATSLTVRQRAETPAVLALWQRLGRQPLAVAGLIYLALLVVTSIAAPSLLRQSPTQIDLLHQFDPPSAQHPLGTDENGRDVLARLVGGSRIS